MTATCFASSTLSGPRACMWAAWWSPSTPGRPPPTPSSLRLEKLGVRVYRHYPIAGLPPQHRPHRQRRGLRQERLYRDHPPPGGGHRPRPRQRQDGHLPQPALPRVQAGGDGGLRQVRDLPHLEPAPEAPGEPGLRGGHRRPGRREHDRPLPSPGLRRDHRQLQPGRGGLPRPGRHV